MVPSITQDDKLRDFYTSLFHTTGYHSFLDQDGCYQKYIFHVCGIQSQDCNHFLNCKNKHEIVAAASQALAALSAEPQDKQFVQEQLASMIHHCCMQKT